MVKKAFKNVQREDKLYPLDINESRKIFFRKSVCNSMWLFTDNRDRERGAHQRLIEERTLEFVKSDNFEIEKKEI